MNMRAAQRVYDNMAPDDKPTVLDDLQLTYEALQPWWHAIGDEVATYACSGRDAFAKDGLIRRLESIIATAAERADNMGHKPGDIGDE